MKVDPNSVEGLDQKFQSVFGKPALPKVDYAKYIAEQEQLEQDEDYQIRKIIDQATVMASFDDGDTEEMCETGMTHEQQHKHRHKHEHCAERKSKSQSRHRHKHSANSCDDSDSSESTCSSEESSSLSSSDTTSEDNNTHHTATPQKGSSGKAKRKQKTTHNKQTQQRKREQMDEYRKQIYEEDSELRATIGPMPSNPYLHCYCLHFLLLIILFRFSFFVSVSFPFSSSYLQNTNDVLSDIHSVANFCAQQ